MTIIEIREKLLAIRNKQTEHKQHLDRISSDPMWMTEDVDATILMVDGLLLDLGQQVDDVAHRTAELEEVEPPTSHAIDEIMGIASEYMLKAASMEAFRSLIAADDAPLDNRGKIALDAIIMGEAFCAEWDGRATAQSDNATD